MLSRLLIVVLILLIFFVIFKLKTLESFSNNSKVNIGIIIPTTSNKRNFKHVSDIDFFKILMPGFLKNCSNKYNYHFYLGIDHDDPFFLKESDNIVAHFKEVTEGKSNFRLRIETMYNLKGKVGAIWSKLAKIAVDNKAEYLYQLGDDINILTSGWEDSFIHKLKAVNNIGVTGPMDINLSLICHQNTNMLTQSFVHKTHLDIFGTYYPEKIENWYIDDWISDVYKPDRYFMIKTIKVKNAGGPPRYNAVKHDKNDLKKLVNEGKQKLKSKLVQ
jgi:hypothetical protein